jgi:hypothetical protein
MVYDLRISTSLRLRIARRPSSRHPRPRHAAPAPTSTMPRDTRATAEAKVAAAKTLGQQRHAMEQEKPGVATGRRGLSDQERKARRAQAQKDWARTARAQLTDAQLAAVKGAMQSLKAGEIETPAFCAAALDTFGQVQDEVARVKLVRAMALLVPPKFRSMYHLLAAGRDIEDVSLEADRAAQLPADEIETGLFLGGWDSVQSAAALHARGITHVLTVGPEEMLADDVRTGSGLTRKVVSLHDMAEVDILAHFDECADFINEALAAGAVRCCA